MNKQDLIDFLQWGRTHRYTPLLHDTMNKMVDEYLKSKKLVPESEASRVIENEQGEKFCNCLYNLCYVEAMKLYCSKCKLPIDVSEIT